MHASDIVGASADNGGLVVFEDGGTIWAMPFDKTGAVAAPQVIKLSPAEPAKEYYYPSIAYGNGMYSAGWSLNGVAAQLVSPAGERIGELIRLDDNGYYPGIVWDGSAFLVAWETITDTGREIAWAQIGTDGTMQKNVVMTNVEDATQPGIAQANGVSLIAWYANPDTQSTGIYGLMVDSDGGSSGGVFRISTADSGYDVRVSSDGNRYLVVWRDGNSLFGRVVASPSEMTDDSLSTDSSADATDTDAAGDNTGANGEKASKPSSDTGGGCSISLPFHQRGSLFEFLFRLI